MVWYCRRFSFLLLDSSNVDARHRHMMFAGVDDSLLGTEFDQMKTRFQNVVINMLRPN